MWQAACVATGGGGGCYQIQLKPRNPSDGGVVSVDVLNPLRSPVSAADSPGNATSPVLSPGLTRLARTLALRVRVPCTSCVAAVLVVLATFVSCAAAFGPYN